MADETQTTTAAPPEAPPEAPQGATPPEAPEGWVSPEVLAEKYIPKATHEALQEEAVKSRLKNHVHREKALDDPAILKAYQEKYGKEGVDLDSHFEKWQKEHADPLVAELEKWRTKAKRAEILQPAADLNIEERYLKRPAEGDPSYLETLVERRLRYHEKYGWIVYDGPGEDAKPMPSGNPEHPFMKADGLLKKWKADPEMAYLFRQETNTSNGLLPYSGTPTAGIGQKPIKDWTPKEKGDYVRQHGEAAWAKLAMQKPGT